MKVNLFLASIAALFLFSCSKNQESEPDSSDLHVINFKVDGFSQLITDIKNIGISSAQDVGLNDMGFLNCYIYDSGGKLVKSRRQVAGDTDFGGFPESVKSGVYTVIFTVSKNDDLIGSSDLLSTVKLFSSKPDDDIFYKKVSVTVGSDDVSENVTLDRVNCYLELILKDIVPAEVTRIDFTLVNDYSGFQLSSGSVVNTGTTCVKKVSLPLTSETDRSNVQLAMSVLNQGVPLTVQIEGFNAKAALVKSVAVQNVKCERNRLTLLSGKMFTDPSAGFHISLNGAWDPVPIEISF